MSKKGLIALVVWYAQEAASLQRQLDPKREQFIVLYREANVRGLRLDKVLITDSFRREHYYASPSEHARVSDWLWLDLKSRLSHTDQEMIFL